MFQDKTWIKMPKLTIFEISLLWRHKSFCFHYWDYLTNIWHNNWRSTFDGVERLMSLNETLSKCSLVQCRIWNDSATNLLIGRRIRGSRGPSPLQICSPYSNQRDRRADYAHHTSPSPPDFQIFLGPCTKGRVISEWKFDVLNFPKNQRKSLINFCTRI